jgi:N-ethylmaleimide reductase
MRTLFDPIQLGSLQLPNRTFMAPLTRGRASPGAIPNDLMAAYYAQRTMPGLSSLRQPPLHSRAMAG